MSQTFADVRLFVRQFQQRFYTTGAVLPSGRALSRELARYVRQPATGAPAGRRILEVGPGTGPATDWIARGMQPDDTFDLVEINEQFVEHLRRRFASEPHLSAVSDRTRILCQSIEALNGEASYDVIVSGLPLNNFSVPEVENILANFRALLKPQGYCSFFEYIGIRRVKGLVVGKAERERLDGVNRAMQAFLTNEKERRPILFNVPPAWVHHVQRPSG
ncbi:MAG: methyltransferase domain-containing protein [Planctomycetaceae bacterium]|nr:methyltransferase domain-containing protein [Planctomycetaceae bacterium]